jgi:hypothetical protein
MIETCRIENKNLTHIKHFKLLIVKVFWCVFNNSAQVGFIKQTKILAVGSFVIHNVCELLYAPAMNLHVIYHIQSVSVDKFIIAAIS